jgi:hypothetical protein
MATRSGTPARTMLRMAVRRRSWKAKATSAPPSALPQLVEKLPTWRPRPLWDQGRIEPTLEDRDQLRTLIKGPGFLTTKMEVPRSTNRRQDAGNPVSIGSIR